MRIGKVDTKVNLDGALTKPVHLETLDYHIEGTNSTVYKDCNESIPGVVNYIWGQERVIRAIEEGRPITTYRSYARMGMKLPTTLSSGIAGRHATST